MKEINVNQQTLLGLLRCSFWGEKLPLPEGIDWEIVAQMAKEQSVIPFAYDGAVKIGADLPAEVLAAWKKRVLMGVMHNERSLRAQGQVTEEFRRAGIPVVVLKGASVSRYYPQPNLRILGDIDILVNKQDLERAQSILAALGYEIVENDHRFHIGYRRKDAYVELHYDVTELPASEGGQTTRRMTDRFLENIGQGKVENHSFPVLSEVNQALMLILHMVRHTFDLGIGLRQLSDWLMYIHSVDKQLFEKEAIPILKQCGLLQYAGAVTRTCVEYLGLPASEVPWCEAVAPEVCDQILHNIFSGGNFGSADKESMGSLFIDSSSMGKKQSPLAALIRGFNQAAYDNFPFLKRWKLLLPIFWVYLPVRYLVRAMLGLRPKKSVIKVVSAANKRRELFDMLRLFDLNSDREKDQSEF